MSRLAVPPVHEPRHHVHQVPEEYEGAIGHVFHCSLNNLMMSNCWVLPLMLFVLSSPISFLCLALDIFSFTARNFYSSYPIHTCSTINLTFPTVCVTIRVPSPYMTTRTSNCLQTISPPLPSPLLSCHQFPHYVNARGMGLWSNIIGHEIILEFEAQTRP